MILNELETLETCYKIYRSYENVLDSFVSDYYLEDHWCKLPKSWQNSLYNTSIEQLGELLDFTKPVKTKIHPLSLLCLRKLIMNNTIPRKKTTISNAHCVFQNNENFMKFFWKNVKLKKRHEINLMAQMCYETAVKTNCFRIVDVGSGLGHLSRMLSYGYGLNVCTFEADHTLSSLSEEMDDNFEKALDARNVEHKCSFKTAHITTRIEQNLSPSEFLNMVKSAFNEIGDNFRFGVVGLHPCGNLGSKLLSLYGNCRNAVFINIASCCYMKLTFEPSINPGFPLSEYCRGRNFTLSYLSCEIACHAIENYVEKLYTKEEYYKLKIHSYRAALEDMLVSINGELKHSPVCSVKYEKNLSFKKYCDKALRNLDVMPSDENSLLYEELINTTWQNVVVFYSIRLLLAPLVETIILLDRLVYIKECESHCDIWPVFDCKISPRNHVISATKINKT